jgi:hypothetical protein
MHQQYCRYLQVQVQVPVQVLVLVQCSVHWTFFERSEAKTSC